jgi:hypothetical protein
MPDKACLPSRSPEREQLSRCSAHVATTTAPAFHVTGPTQARYSGHGIGVIWLLTRIVLNIRTQCPGSSRCASTDTRWSPCAPSAQSWPVDRFYTIAKPVRCSFCVTAEYEHVFDVLTFTSTPHDVSRRWPKKVPRLYST